MKQLVASRVCDRFVWNTSPREIEESNFAHMAKITLQALLGANQTALDPFNIEGTEIEGYKFVGLIVVVDDTIDPGLIYVRK